MTPEQRRQHVEDACAAIILAGQTVTFDEVAARTLNADQRARLAAALDTSDSSVVAGLSG